MELLAEFLSCLQKEGVLIEAYVREPNKHGV